MNIFADYFDNQISQLLSSIQKYSGKNDGHIKGTLAELTIKNIHTNLFPSHIGTTRGWIIDNIGNRTEERDIVVYNKNSAPVFMLDGSTGLIPAEAVINDIQVKSRIGIRDIGKLYNSVVQFYKIPQNTLFSFNAEIGDFNPLEAFLSKDEQFLSSPKIQNIVIGSHGFYIFEMKDVPLSDYFSHDDIVNKIKELFPILEDEALSEIQKVVPFDIIENINEPTSVTFNNVDVIETINKSVQIVSWHGLHLDKKFEDAFRYYFTISMNNLFRNDIGKYLLKGNLEMKTFSRKIFFEEKEIFSKVDLKNGFNRGTGRFAFKMRDGKCSLTCSEEDEEV